MILIFLKSPVPGRVKTRLSSSLGESLTCRLYKRFTEDTLTSAETCRTKITLCYYPENKKQPIQNWLGSDYRLKSQTGANLGERMFHAFGDAFISGEEKAVLIGTDIPQIRGETLNKALAALDTHDSVIGPSQDGGYYLIGFNRRTLLKDVFNNITWGSASVLTSTLQILAEAHYKTCVLEKYNDIDTLQDLKDYYLRNYNNKGLRTTRFITDHIPGISKIVL